MFPSKLMERKRPISFVDVSIGNSASIDNKSPIQRDSLSRNKIELCKIQYKLHNNIALSSDQLKAIENLKLGSRLLPLKLKIGQIIQELEDGGQASRNLHCHIHEVPSIKNITKLWVTMPLDYMSSMFGLLYEAKPISNSIQLTARDGSMTDGMCAIWGRVLSEMYYEIGKMYKDLSEFVKKSGEDKCAPTVHKIIYSQGTGPIKIDEKNVIDKTISRILNMKQTKESEFTVDPFVKKCLSELIEVDQSSLQTLPQMEPLKVPSKQGSPVPKPKKLTKEAIDSLMDQYFGNFQTRMARPRVQTRSSPLTDNMAKFLTGNPSKSNQWKMLKEGMAKHYNETVGLLHDTTDVLFDAMSSLGCTDETKNNVSMMMNLRNELNDQMGRGDDWETDMTMFITNYKIEEEITKEILPYLKAVFGSDQVSALINDNGSLSREREAQSMANVCADIVIGIFEEIENGNTKLFSKMFSNSEMTKKVQDMFISMMREGEVEESELYNVNSNFRRRASKTEFHNQSQQIVKKATEENSELHKDDARENNSETKERTRNFLTRFFDAIASKAKVLTYGLLLIAGIFVMMSIFCPSFFQSEPRTTTKDKIRVYESLSGFQEACSKNLDTGEPITNAYEIRTLHQTATERTRIHRENIMDNLATLESLKSQIDLGTERLKSLQRVSETQYEELKQNLDELKKAYGTLTREMLPERINDVIQVVKASELDTLSSSVVQEFMTNVQHVFENVPDADKNIRSTTLSLINKMIKEKSVIDLRKNLEEIQNQSETKSGFYSWWYSKPSELMQEIDNIVKSDPDIQILIKEAQKTQSDVSIEQVQEKVRQGFSNVFVIGAQAKLLEESLKHETEPIIQQSINTLKEYQESFLELKKNAGMLENLSNSVNTYKSQFLIKKNQVISKLKEYGTSLRVQQAAQKVEEIAVKLGVSDERVHGILGIATTAGIGHMRYIFDGYMTSEIAKLGQISKISYWFWSALDYLGCNGFISRLVFGLLGWFFETVDSGINGIYLALQYTEPRLAEGEQISWGIQSALSNVLSMVQSEIAPFQFAHLAGVCSQLLLIIIIAEFAANITTEKILPRTSLMGEWLSSFNRDNLIARTARLIGGNMVSGSSALMESLNSKKTWLESGRIYSFYIGSASYFLAVSSMVMQAVIKLSPAQAFQGGIIGATYLQASAMGIFTFLVGYGLYRLVKPVQYIVDFSAGIAALPINVVTGSLLSSSEVVVSRSMVMDKLTNQSSMLEFIDLFDGDYYKFRSALIKLGMKEDNIRRIEQQSRIDAIVATSRPIILDPESLSRLLMACVDLRVDASFANFAQKVFQNNPESLKKIRDLSLRLTANSGTMNSRLIDAVKWYSLRIVSKVYYLAWSKTRGNQLMIAGQADNANLKELKSYFAEMDVRYNSNTTVTVRPGGRGLVVTQNYSSWLTKIEERDLSRTYTLARTYTKMVELKRSIDAMVPMSAVSNFLASFTVGIAMSFIVRSTMDYGLSSMIEPFRVKNLSDITTSTITNTTGSITKEKLNQEDVSKITGYLSVATPLLVNEITARSDLLESIVEPIGFDSQDYRTIERLIEQYPDKVADYLRPFIDMTIFNDVVSKLSAFVNATRLD